MIAHKTIYSDLHCLFWYLQSIGELYFSTVFILPQLTRFLRFLSHILLCRTTVPSVGIDDVDRGLSALKTTGPGCLSRTILYNIRSALCFSLWLMFCLSLDSETGPSILWWVLLNLCSVYKSGDKTNVKNYEPVSIQNYVAKIFELLFLIYLILYFDFLSIWQVVWI